MKCQRVEAPVAAGWFRLRTPRDILVFVFGVVVLLATLLVLALQDGWWTLTASLVLGLGAIWLLRNGLRRR